MRYNNFNDQEMAVDRLRDRMVHPSDCPCWIRDRVTPCLDRAKSPKAREILTIMLECVSGYCYCVTAY